MNETLEAQVLIVGAGPVGLTLAIDLAQRGVDVLVAEIRHRGEPPSVKSNHVSARSMETFRRLGLAQKVRNAGLPADYPNDVAYRTSFTGLELSRIPIPARQDRYTATGGPDTWWPTPEPPHRINQLFLEPIIFDHAAQTPGLRIINRLRIDDFGQDTEGVQAKGVCLDTGNEIRIDCQYLIGCDGGRSGVRKKIGAKLEGMEVVARVQSTYVRAPSLLSLTPCKPAWATFSLNPRRSGNVYAIDGKQTWLVHNYLKPQETFDSVDRDRSLRDILGVGADFGYEILSKEDWTGRRLVADRFRDRRVFICGDASHLWVPMAGYGMNAGIADAMNLSWLLAGHLQGWMDEAALQAYEEERRPITEQVSKFAMMHSFSLEKERQRIPEGLEEAGEKGDALRGEVGKALYELNVQQYCCAGLNFGYFYDRSPLIAYDGEQPPGYTMSDFTTSTVPGCRTPHLWLKDGRSLYDAMGQGYTLLRRDPTIDVQRLLDAASSRGLPLTLIDLDTEESGTLYPEPLVISRPDQHIAWRGTGLPSDPLALIDLLRGVGAKASETHTRAA